MWGDERILSKHWVRRSSAMYSIDDEILGYGFMWWIYREPRFERQGMYAAQGVGNQLIAALPESDLVIVNRANTYEGEGTPSAALLDLVEQVLDARTGSVAAEPKLAPLEELPRPGITSVPTDRLLDYAGRWAYPPEWLGLTPNTWVEMDVRDGHLLSYSPVSGAFKLYLQPDGSFHEEDSRDRYFPLRNDDGRFVGISGVDGIVTAALSASAEGDRERGADLLELVESEEGAGVEVGRAVSWLFDGKPERAEGALAELAETHSAGEIEARVNGTGYRFLIAGKSERAVDVFALNTRVFPDAFNTWDSLGEAQMSLGEHEDAIRSYEKSLELNPRNDNAATMIAKMRESE
jgi:tetratricopeptide (TPR) repeat protein